LNKARTSWSDGFGGDLVNQQQPAILIAANFTGPDKNRRERMLTSMHAQFITNRREYSAALGFWRGVDIRWTER
jgi:hypothetical protein